MGSLQPQTDLFGGGALELPRPIPVQPGRFALADRLATAMSRAMTTAGQPRHTVAARIQALTGKRLTENVLNNMASMSRHDQVPNLLQAMAFDAVTGLHALLDLYAGALGGRVIFGEEIVALELGKVALAKRQLSQRGHYLNKIVGVGR
jgi:hypothetical protein